MAPPSGCPPLLPLASALLLTACAAEPPTQASRNDSPPAPQSFARSEWSEPVKLDAPVNSPIANDQGPALSADGLALYFCSNRPGGWGGNDLWVARRASEDDPWGEPVNLGPTVNSAGGDCGPSLSVHGRLLFFTSNRPGGAGANDIYVASRTDPADDLAWGVPVRLGPEVNTAATELSPFVTRFRGDCAGGDEGGDEASGPNDDGAGCVAELYFERGPSNVATNIYVAAVNAEGAALGPAVPVAEVNSADAEGRPTVRFDGREMLIHSNRDGRGGDFDIFVSTRRSPNHPWSAPAPAGGVNSSPQHEIQPYLSRNGRTMVFARGTGQANDLWMSTRTPSRD